MGGGGKGGTSTSTVSIPPEVLARYNAVNATAQNVAQQPFQAYSTDPNAFVAPVNAVQTSGINNIYNAQNAAQPWYSAAGQTYAQGAQASEPYTNAAGANINNALASGVPLTALSAMPVNPQQIGAGQINQFMNPYAADVIGGTLAPLQQQQAMDRQAQISSQIRSGAFGGDRGGISNAVLRGQQEMATGNVVGNLLNPMYSQALGAAQQQQGVNLAAQQANRAALAQAGQQLYGQYTGAAGAQGNLANQLFGAGVTGAQTLGSLGTGAQNAAISGGQAALAAGTVPQQTQQAGLSALYNQFQQQQGYPFQVAQFLANIAEGTGALSGSTTTTTQPTSFFSDERLKEDIEPIGETYDGQKIVKFRYKGEKGPKQIGLVAQDVEKHHPDAVGHDQGYKTVDYDKATRHAAARGHFYKGGIVPSSEGGFVHMGHAGEGFARGGYYGGGSTASIVDPVDLNALLSAHQQMYAPFNAANLYGGASPAGGQKGGIVPAGTMPVPKLVTASNVAPQNQATLGSALHGAVQAGSDVTQGYGMGKAALFGSPATKDEAASKGLIGSGGSSSGSGYLSDAKKALGFTDDTTKSARGGVIPFRRDAGGGLPYGGDQDETKGYMGTISYERKSPQELKNEQDAQRQGKLPSQPQSGLGSALGTASQLYGASKLGKAGFEGAKDLLGTGAASTAPGVGGATGLAAAHAAAEAPLAGAIVPAEAAVAAPAAAEAAGGAGLLGSIGEGLGSLATFLLPIGLNQGGVVPREHHAGPDSTNNQSNVVGDGGGGDNDNTADTGRVSPKDLYDHLISQGADPRTALVLTSGAASESGFNPTARHDFDENGVAQGYGLFGHQGPRLDAMRQQTGTQYPNWKQQASFALSEMQDPRYQKMIAAAQSPEDLTKVQMHFERPKGYTPDNPEAGHNYTGRVADTNALMPLVLGQDVNWGAATRAAAGKPSQGGLGGADKSSGKDWTDTLTSDKFIVPVLSGLAGMASSPSRYLGAAILQGLGAGAQSYQQMKQQESAIAKQQADIQREREQSQIGFGQLNVQQQQVNIQRTAKVIELMDKLRQVNATRQIANMPPLSTEEFFNQNGATDLIKEVPKVQASGSAGGNGAVGTAVQVAKDSNGITLPKPVAVDSTASAPNPNSDFWKGVDPQDNIHTLQRNYQIAMAGNLPTVAEKILADINRVKTSGMVLKNGQMTPIPGFAESEAAKKFAVSQAEAEAKEPSAARTKSMEVLVPINAAAQSEAYKEAQNASNLLQQTNAMMNQAFDKDGKPTMQMGPLAKAINENAAVMKQLGFSDQFLKDFMGTDPAKPQTIEKLRTSLSSEISRQELAGSPVRVSEFNKYFATVPNQDLLPEAYKYIIKNILQPKAQSMIGAYEHVAQMDPAKDNIQYELHKYGQENQWYKTKSDTGAAASAQTPVKIKSPEEIKNLAPNTPFIIPTGKDKGKIGYAQ
jgi:Chaperone of endosialidase/Phage tail lysozyme